MDKSVLELALNQCVFVVISSANMKRQLQVKNKVQSVQDVNAKNFDLFHEDQKSQVSIGQFDEKVLTLKHGNPHANANINTQIMILILLDANVDVIHLSLIFVASTVIKNGKSMKLKQSLKKREYRKENQFRENFYPQPLLQKFSTRL